MHPVIQVAPARSDASIPIPIRVLQEEQSKSKPRSHGKRLERETFLLEPCQPETAPLQPYRPFRLLHAGDLEELSQFSRVSRSLEPGAVLLRTMGCTSLHPPAPVGCDCPPAT